MADNRWNISQDTVAFTISIETFSRAAEGPAYTNNIFFDVLDRSEAQTLIDAIGRDLTLNVTTTKGKSFGDFSLKGSQAAMRAFAPCWDGIQQASAAATSSGPFSDTSTYSRSYDHTLEDDTWQTWSVENESYNDNGNWGVDIRGEGPLGEFLGNLGVSCQPTISWQWARTYLGASSIPDEAMSALMQFVCRES